MRYVWLALAISFLTLTGCKTAKQHDLSYFTPLLENNQGEFDMASYQIKIQPDDELMITVSSQVPEAVKDYNIPMINPATNKDLMTPANMRQQTYIVNQDGDITFPILGKINVKGLTTMELAEKLEKEISKDVEDPTVRVVLVNFKVNVLGAVDKPGPIPVTREKFSILDAIASAQDMTEYARRDNVLLLRERDGKTEYHIINLEDSSVFTSPYFYLQPNDVVIVDPNEILKANSRYNTLNSYKLQVVSSVVSACSVIASLIIALTVK